MYAYTGKGVVCLLPSHFSLVMFAPAGCSQHPLRPSDKSWHKRDIHVCHTGQYRITYACKPCVIFLLETDAESARKAYAVIPRGFAYYLWKIMRENRCEGYLSVDTVEGDYRDLLR